jgi:hypothetical protein
VFLLVNLVMSFGESVLGTLTTEASRNRATILKTALASSKVRLCQAPFTFANGTTKEDAVAAEADFDGYTPGGNTITAFGNPLDVTGGGAAIGADTTFAYVDDDTHVANTISAGWIELAAGGIVFPFNLQNPLTFNSNGDGIIFQFLDTEGAS